MRLLAVRAVYDFLFDISCREDLPEDEHRLNSRGIDWMHEHAFACYGVCSLLRSAADETPNALVVDLIKTWQRK